MIESNIMDWIDLGDSVQILEMYLNKRLIKLFNFFRIMTKYKSDSRFFIFLVKFFFFFQFMMIPIININEKQKKTDSLLKILNYVKKIIFIQDIIKKKNDLIIVLCFSYIFCISLICHIVYLMFNQNKKLKTYILKSLNIYNFFLQNFLLCPLINILMLTTRCKQKKHIHLDLECWKDIKHIILGVISLLFLLICIIYSILLSIYYNQIGGIKNFHLLHNVNSNYQLISNTLSIICYFLGYFLEYYTDETEVYYKIGNRVFICVISIGILFYNYKNVFYYDDAMNKIIMFGWSFIAWYCICLLTKHYLHITDIILFVFIGWIVIGLIIYILLKYKVEYYLTQFNVLEAKNLKEVEIFTSNLLGIVSENSTQSKTLLRGLIFSLKEFFQNNAELYEKYEKFENNKIMIQKYGGPDNPIFDVYNIIYIIYDFYLNKSHLKNDILLVFCYFLVNKLKNITYAYYLCSKNKVSSHKLSYLKYCLIEELKEYLVGKMNKNSNNKETIKHVQIGSVILYNSYIDTFKLKIYDAACNQIDYFETLKNTTTSLKATVNFLNLGETILKLRKDILDLWNKIIELNAFSDENEKDYMLYLQNIIQDEELAEKEEKRYNQIKLSKLSEKNNIYHSLFLKDTCVILLFDGSNYKCKILYSTSNFQILFNFHPKEILSLNIHDLMPSCVSDFHKDIVQDALKYSNLSYLFNKKVKNAILKSRNNYLYNINIYIKCLPNLSHGIIFIGLIEKLKDNQFLILLDNFFKINSMSDTYSITSGDIYSTLKKDSYGLNNNILNHHIAIIIPEILKQIKYSDQKFLLSKNDMDLKGILYPNTMDFSNIESEVDMVLERIKQSGQLITEEINQTLTNNNEIISRTNTKMVKIDSNVKEYNELIEELNEKFAGKSYSIFYKIVMRTFLNDKFVYYRLYLTKDILDNNENNVFKMNFSISINDSQNKSIGGTNIYPIQNNIIGNKPKVIKLKVPDENNKMLPGKNNSQKVNSNPDLNNKINDKNNNDKTNNIQEKISQNSFSTKSSVDSASFNKLKARIIDKNEPFFITYMKIISLIYFIVTGVFIYFDNQSIKKKFSKTQDYLSENYFFNSSKIVINCIYLTGVNLKFLKYNIISKDGCLGDSCETIYITLFSNCLDLIKNTTSGLSYYDNDYKTIISKTKNIDIYVYNVNNLNNIFIDTPNLLQFILSNGLRLKSDINTFLEDLNNTSLEVFEENIINCSFGYVNDMSIAGLKNDIKSKYLSQKRFNPNYFYMIINVCVFAFVFLIFIYLIFKTYKLEIFFLTKLIWYHSNNFDNYLKYLDDLKKKLRSDNGEDDNTDELKFDSNNNNEESSENSVDKKVGNKNKENSVNISNDEKQKVQKKKKKRKYQGRMSKIQQQKKEKINIMKKYFIFNNIFIAIRLLIILLFSILYYLIVSLVYSKRKNDFISIDNIMCEVIGIFNESAISFSIIKNQTLHYVNYNIQKENYIKQLTEGTITNVTIDNIIYTIDDIDTLNQTNYTLIIPSINDIAIPKLGNVLLPLISNAENGKKNSPYTQLYQLFYGDICELLYSNIQFVYNNCVSFWSAIMKQGLEQTITQLSVELNTILDDFKSINNGEKTLKEVNDYSGTLGQIEVFINFFFLETFFKTRSLFSLIRNDKIHGMKILIDYIFTIFILILPISFFFLIAFIYQLKYSLNSFLNFIGILPIQYLSEDENFYKDTLKIEGNIFE